MRSAGAKLQTVSGPTLEEQITVQAESDLVPRSSTEETIRVRADQIYLQRGASNGLDVEDWLQAERELLG